MQNGGGRDELRKKSTVAEWEKKFPLLIYLIR
jgi:hypothetical protein